MANKPTEREFSIIIPKKDNEGHLINVERLRDYALDMSKQFGGVTVNPKVVGCGIHERTKKLDCDESVYIFSVRDIKKEDFGKADQILEKDRKFMHGLARKAQKQFGQWGILTQEDIVQDNVFVMGKKRKKIGNVLWEKDVFRRNL